MREARSCLYDALDNHNSGSEIQGYQSYSHSALPPYKRRLGMIITGPACYMVSHSSHSTPNTRPTYKVVTSLPPWLPSNGCSGCSSYGIFTIHPIDRTLSSPKRSVNTVPTPFHAFYSPIIKRAYPPLSNPAFSSDQLIPSCSCPAAPTPLNPPLYAPRCIAVPPDTASASGPTHGYPRYRNIRLGYHHTCPGSQDLRFHSHTPHWKGR